MAQRELGEPEFWSALRFDVISVLRGRNGVEIAHLPGVF
jgi:hypothetical protein